MEPSNLNPLSKSNKLVESTKLIASRRSKNSIKMPIDVNEDLMTKKHMTDIKSLIKITSPAVNGSKDISTNNSVIYSESPLQISSRRSASVQNVALLGLGDRASVLSGAYERLEQEEEDN